ncbi:transcriptional regulatory protein WalR [Clostridium tepidiprofundi DSM 19306]|uniref:Stage 0 sporulation protein A homolog n=1 Tax=Clostridium tepidiprofundi DSM 19306 TaxID=1121338 RepID=A0A151B322_9CLOT|nr:response regulator transcription factor [Clostridium tepidiprofundi]KYH34190.1 transcriptional regulatory protein WalR [Clostridium tepidiprofundi DSM 19306]
MENTIKEKKILIIDDEKDILNLLSTVLTKEGFKKIYTAETGEEGLKLFNSKKPDIILLDIMLPDKEGYEICKKIRETSMIPILFLSAKSEEMDKILGFALGGDDYITKPFSPKELAYRIKAHLRRNEIRFTENKDLSFGPFEINEEKMEVRKNGILLNLKPKELKLFLYMAKHPNQIINKERICNEVWGEDYIGFDNTIMVHIRRLREKIEDNPSEPKYIVNIKGLGYKLLVKDEQ